MIHYVINLIIILVFLVAYLKMITSSKRKNEKTKETTNDQIELICWDIISLLAFCLFVFINAKDADSKCFYIFVYILSLFVGLSAISEVRKKNEDMVDYLLYTLVYIEMITFISFLIQQLEGIKYTKKGQVNTEFLLFLSIGVMLSMIAIWCIYFQMSKLIHENIKNNDLIDLKTLFLKSTFQSITAFIALYGLASSGLPNFYLTFALFINAIAAFSYPILDINKYIHQKETEFSEKNFAPIRPIDESKE